jgi:hypothetical protein
MRLHKANYLHLFLAAFDLAQSDREEMDRVEPGRDPIDVLTASAGDPTTMAITDFRGAVLAVGGTCDGIIWFVHTKTAERLSMRDRKSMLGLLAEHLVSVKLTAIKANPDDYFHFTNIVSVDNHRHLKLLKHLGAEFATQVKWKNGSMFLQFFF